MYRSSPFLVPPSQGGTGVWLRKQSAYTKYRGTLSAQWPPVEIQRQSWAATRRPSGPQLWQATVASLHRVFL